MQLVVSCAALDVVVAFAALEEVAATQPIDGVVAVQALDVIGNRTSASCAPPESGFGEDHRRSAQELTPQERQVVLPVAEGKTNEAAAALFLSPKTVEFHLSSLYHKLGVSSRAELVKRVSTKGLEALVPA